MMMMTNVQKDDDYLSIYLWFLYLQVPSAAPGRNSDDGGVLPP
jgi:hypothetical protein